MDPSSAAPARMSAEEIAEQRRTLDHFERLNLEQRSQSQTAETANPSGLPNDASSYAPPPGPPPSQRTTSNAGYIPPPGPPPSYQAANAPGPLDQRYPAATTSYSHEEEKAAPPSDEADEMQILDTAMGFARQKPPPSYESMPTLRLPVAIPQLTRGFGDPFARAYAPELAQHGISAEEFVSFIDSFNVVTTNSPPLQVLDLVGGAIGFVPWHWATLVSHAISATAKIGARVVSKTTGDRLLKRANEEFFHPRRLHVDVARTEALRQIARIPANAPLAAPLNASTVDMSIAERQMGALQPWLSPLDMNVPPPTPQTSALKRLCEKQVEQQTKRSETKMRKERLKALEKGAMLPPDEERRLIQTLQQSSDPKIAKEAEKVAEKRQEEHEKQAEESFKMQKERNKIEREAEKDIAKARQKGEPEKEREALAKRDEELAKLDKDIHKESIKRRESFEKDDKEQENAAKGKWMVVHVWDGRK